MVPARWLILLGVTVACFCCEVSLAEGWQGASVIENGLPRGGSTRVRRVVPPTTTNRKRRSPVAPLWFTDPEEKNHRFGIQSDEKSSSDGKETLRKSDKASEKTSNPPVGKLEAALFATYFLNSLALALPIVLLPMIAAEHAVGGGGLGATAFVAAAASISTLGGGVGKVVNGFVCQSLGGRQSASIYLMAIAALSTLLSFNTVGSNVGWILAAMEFFASIQWTACSVVLANHYERFPAKFAAGIMVMSLASTSGSILGKMGGSALLQTVPSWRLVARVGAGAALLGSLLLRVLVSEFPTEPKNSWMTVVTRNRPEKKSSALDIQSVVQSLRHVLGSRLFWMVGLAHSTAFLARTSDRVLGAFFHEVAALPRSLCGGFTACVTFGFVHGLAQSQVFHKTQDPQVKSRFLRRKYASSVASAMGLALCANKWFKGSLLPSNHLIAALAALLSGSMASSLSFQFYQIPPLVATTFGRNKAVCLSFLDGMGFLLSAPVWAATSRIIGGLENHGWSVTWLMLASLFASGGFIMLQSLDHILKAQREAIATG